MKILYAIQGTGNGHLSRAIEIIPYLQQYAEIDILVSGIQSDLLLPFPVKYKLKGLSFIFGKNGGIDFWKTFTRASLRKLIKSIHQLPVDDYDLIINDFEPVSAWACYLKNKECIALSHQAAVLIDNYPRPERDENFGRLILQSYAPATFKYGFHFTGNNENIFTHVIRKSVRKHQVSDEGHYTVYLPAYDDKRLIKKLSEFPDVQWEVFSKHNVRKVSQKNITIQPVNDKLFTASMASSSGVLCGAGFETPAEALYLGKKLLIIPMKDQYEQHLNAAALKEMNVPVIKSLKDKYLPVISEWLENGRSVPVDFPDQTQEIISRIVSKHTYSQL